jgi:hypothetical protein
MLDAVLHERKAFESLSLTAPAFSYPNAAAPSRHAARANAATLGIRRRRPTKKTRAETVVSTRVSAP